MARFLIENYGCQMNTAEADSLRALLSASGHTEEADPARAEVVLINTCSVRKTAEQRIVGRIGFYRGLNQQNGTSIRAVVMGCMSRPGGEALRKQFPDIVGLVWGTYHKERIVPLIERIASGAIPAEDYLGWDAFDFLDAAPDETFPFKAFVPVAHGCDNYCAYCIVPYVRGPEVHRPSDEILANISALKERGVMEICLLGQNVNSYRDGRSGFPELLARAATQSGIPRITFLTSHPKDFSKELADVMKEYPAVMPFLHLPFQAGSAGVLARMNRKYTPEQYMEKIAWGKSVPGITLSTDILVGFPGETDDDFEATMRIVEDVRFNDAYMYRYSTRPGTAAEKMEGHVPEKIKLARLARLIARQKAIGRELLPAHIGESHTALMESVSRKNRHMLSGRTHSNLAVFVTGGKELIGRIVELKITGVSGIGLTGEIK
ncbi:MAG: tRNA (N6-isopentenyl adenosine(37)-C2)-methylthiotransferase MiaB [Spirochaetes bacterium GWF1_51_8]|nr:MAG: tRNA (N6-isopentenyl adenosine(37)-C2)-methylthiotransferase MiaB [Spirochaetes bacterium GWF1_51_8]